MPLVEIGNGVRREEICQLRVQHVVRRFGIWCIDLTAANVRTKTDDGSPRLIPIHKEVLAAGFIEALVDGRPFDNLLLSDLNNDNAHEAYGVGFGKRISNYVTNVTLDFSASGEMIENLFCSEDDVAFLSTHDPKRAAEIRSKFSNHGIRHWWETTAINAGCSPAHVDELLGHVGEQRGEALRYQKELHVRALKETVDKVPMPFRGAELKLRFQSSEKQSVGHSPSYEAGTKPHPDTSRM